jgi:branched-subunit amino acid transport protein
MTTDLAVLAALVGMGAVTYAARAGGFWAMSLVPATRRLERFLRHLASSVIVAILVGSIARADAVVAVAVAVVAAVMAATRNAMAAIAAGIAAAALIRQVLTVA